VGKEKGLLMRCALFGCVRSDVVLLLVPGEREKNKRGWMSWIGKRPQRSNCQRSDFSKSRHKGVCLGVRPPDCVTATKESGAP